MLKTVPKLNLSIPDHTILDKIGEGGMSAVYLGRQISLQRKVAIKVLKKLVMDDKTLAERFVDEAKTVASLDHPHIISIYEAKKLPSGLAYFTMPYLTHGDFGEIICTNSEHLIELLCQICDGLSHAHKHGVIHRDLKPENILFDQFGRIKIADFGIAISKKAKRRTKDTQLLGSAHYMSPEQIQSKEIDHHTDIYSLGCIIYEKLTGDHVFSANNDFSILMSHINKPIPELPKALAVWQPIINKCLAKEPSERYQSVTEVKDALLEIKYNKHKATEQKHSQKGIISWITKPQLWMAASALLFTLLAILYFSQQSTNPNKIEPPAEAQTATIEPAITPEQDTDLTANASTDDPLTITVGVLNPDADGQEELVDLTGNLDNETINEMSIEVKLNEAQELLESYRLTKPRGDNAADKYQAVLLEQPDNQTAQDGLNKVGIYYFRLIESKLKDNDSATALEYTQSLVNYINEYNINRDLFELQVSEIMSATDQLVSQAISNRRRNQAVDNHLKMADLLVPKYAFVENLKQSYANIPTRGQVSSDPSGHAFVFIPSQRSNGVGDLWVGQSEVTVAQFAQFAGERFAEEKCLHYGKKTFFKKTWLKPPFDQTNTHPVICVTAQNAQDYANWLNQQSTHNYRLPTAQEWQQLNQSIKTNHNCQAANVAGLEVEDENKSTDNPLNCQDGFVFTAPINSFPESLNTQDFNGNVAEWVSQCQNGGYCAAGSSWRSGQQANNTQLKPLANNETHSHVGFRLIREL